MADPDPPSDPVAGFGVRLDEVRQRIDAAAARSGRRAAAVRLLAVTKTASDADLHAAWAVGQRQFAHNRVQNLQRQHAQLPAADWHLIGPLQSNKARRAVGLCTCIQSLASGRQALALQRLASELQRGPLAIMVQVNHHPEDGRHGVREQDLPSLLEECAALDHLRVDGLMTLAPQRAEEAVLRGTFAALRQAAEQARCAGLLPEQAELSMGMSNDYETAIEEGATLVRVGRALFPST